MAEEFASIYAAPLEGVRFTVPGANIQPPNTDVATNKLRDDLFLYHITRQNLLGTVKSLQDLEQVLSERLTNGLLLSEQSGVKPLIQHMCEINSVKEEIKAVLQVSDLNTEAISIIDELLQEHIGNLEHNLYDELPAREVSKAAVVKENMYREEVQEIDDFIRRMPEMWGVQPDFYEGWKHGEVGAVKFRNVQRAASDVPDGFIKKEAVKLPSIDITKYKELDKQSALVSGFYTDCFVCQH